MDKNIGAYIVFTPCCNDGEVLEFGDTGNSTWWISAVEGDVYEYTPTGGDPTLNGCYIVTTVSNPIIPPTQVPTNAEMRYLGRDCEEAAKVESLCECEEVTILVPCCQGDKSLYFQATKRIFNPTEAYTYKDKSYTVVKSTEPTPQIGFPPPFPGDDEVIGENVPCDDTDCCVCIRVRSRKIIPAPISVIIVNCDGVNEGLTILTDRAWSEKICARSWDLDEDTFEIEIFGDCIDDVCPITTCFLLTDCEGIQEDIYATYTSMESSLGQGDIIKIDGFPDTCWSYNEISECECAIEVSVLSIWNDCEECRKCKGYKVTNCEDSTYIKYTTNDLSEHVGQTVEFQDCDGCWFVECMEIAPPADQNLVVAFSFKNCKSCLSTFWKLTPCVGQEHDPIYTDTDLSSYESFIVTLDNIPGICFELEQIRDLEGNNFETVFINEYYADCDACKAEIFDCQCSTAINGGPVSESLQYLDCNGNWIETAIIPSGARSPKVCAIEWDLKNAIDIEWYGECKEEIENEESIWKCPKVKSRVRSVRPGYDTPGCPADYFDKVSCKFSEALYKDVLADRYGITTNCSPSELNKWDIKKELLNMAAITNPDYDCPPVSMGCYDPCQPVAGFINCLAGDCFGYSITYEENAPDDIAAYTDCETNEATTINHTQSLTSTNYFICTAPGTSIITEGFLELLGDCTQPPCVETYWEITMPPSQFGSQFTITDCAGNISSRIVPPAGGVYNACAASIGTSGMLVNLGPCPPPCVESNYRLTYETIPFGARGYTATDCEGITIAQEVQPSGGVFEVCSVQAPVISGLPPVSIEEIGDCTPPPCVNSLWEVSVPVGVFSTVQWTTCEGITGSQIVIGPNTIEVCASAEPTGGIAVNVGPCPPPPCVLINWEMSFATSFASYNSTDCEGVSTGQIVIGTGPAILNTCSLEGSPPTGNFTSLTQVGICPPD